jgi:hypothetical protein
MVCSAGSIFLIKFFFEFCLQNCGPGYNLKWWWSNVTMSWPTIFQKNSKKNFLTEYAAVENTTPIKIHKVAKEF